MEITGVVRFTFIVGVIVTMSRPTAASLENTSDACANYSLDPHATCTDRDGQGWGIACHEAYELDTTTMKCNPIESSDTGTVNETCTSSRDCLSSLQCKNGKCIDPCEGQDSFDHATCKTEYHKSKYVCQDGYEHPSYSNEYCFPISVTKV